MTDETTTVPGGGAAGPAADDLPWPPWLENLSDEERIEAIVAAVAACYGGHNGPHDDGSADQHCTASMAGALLAKLLPVSPGDGVSRWTVTRLGLIEALRSVALRIDLAQIPGPAALADAVLAHLPESAPPGAPEGHTGANGAGNVSPDTGSGSGALRAAADGPGEYRWLPVPVQAWRVTAENAEQVARWCAYAWVEHSCDGVPHVCVNTLNGPVDALAGDWVVRDGEGQFWPVPGERFAGLYERVNRGAPAADDAEPALPFAPPGDPQMRPATHRRDPDADLTEDGWPL